MRRTREYRGGGLARQSRRGHVACQNCGMPYQIAIVFDFETTGLDAARGDEIIEIGAVPIIDGVVREDCAFHTLIDPDRAIPKDSSAIHGIVDDMVRGKPRLDVVLPEFVRYLGRHDLVAQNAEFDVGFLKAGCKKLELSHPPGKVDCTMLMSRQVFAGERRHSLDEICRRLEIEIGNRHRSIDDVLLTARAWLHLAARMGRSVVGR